MVGACGGGHPGDAGGEVHPGPGGRVEQEHVVEVAWRSRAGRRAQGVHAPCWQQPLPRWRGILRIDFEARSRWHASGQRPSDRWEGSSRTGSEEDSGRLHSRSCVLDAQKEVVSIERTTPKGRGAERGVDSVNVGGQNGRHRWNQSGCMCWTATQLAVRETEGAGARRNRGREERAAGREPYGLMGSMRSNQSRDPPPPPPPPSPQSPPHCPRFPARDGVGRGRAFSVVSARPPHPRTPLRTTACIPPARPPLEAPECPAPPLT